MRQICLSSFLSVMLGCIIAGQGLVASGQAITNFTQALQILSADQRSGGPLGGERAKRPARGDAGKHKPTKYVPPADDFDFGDFGTPTEPTPKKPENPTESQPKEPVVTKPVIAEPEPAPVCADVQAVSYLKDLDIKIREGSGSAQLIPLAADKMPLTFDSICSQKGIKTETKYTVTFNGDPLAEVTCIVGPTSDSYMQVVITKEEQSSSKIAPVTSIPFKTPDSTSNVLAEIKLPGIKKPTQDTISRVRLMVDMVKEKSKNTFKISIDAVPTCTSKALIEAVNKRADLKKIEIKLDQDAQLVEIPSSKPYVSLGYVCQDEGVATRTCAVLVNGKEIAEIDLRLGPRSAETREAAIRILAPKIKDQRTVSGKSDEQISAVAVLDNGMRLRITVQPVKEGLLPLWSKFKIYFQEAAACDARARVEIVDQRPDLKNVELIDTYGRHFSVLDISKQPWALIDEICREKSAEAKETYQLMIGTKKAAEITAVFGPESEEFLQATITAGADARGAGESITSDKFTLAAGVQKFFLDIFVPGAGYFKLAVELVKEGGQSKFKIYLQDVLSCVAKAVVEVINQRKDLGKIEIKDNYDQVFDIPDTTQKPWLSIGGFCQLPSKPVQETYALFVASKPVARITSILGPADGEFMRATITRLSGAEGSVSEITSGDYKGLGKDQVIMPLVVPGLGWLVVKVELIKESGQSKFKIYIQEPGACGAQAWVEIQNQIAGLDVTVEDSYKIKTAIPDWSKRGYVTLAPICQEKEVNNQETYTLAIQGKKVAEVSCIFGPVTNEVIQATIRAFDAQGKQISEAEGLSYENVSAILGPVTSGERYVLRVITEKVSGQSKFKWYLQPLEACGPRAVVEAQNQTSLEFKIKNTYGKEALVPNWSKVGYISFDNICQKKSEVAEEDYTIFVNGQPAARVRCKLGPASNETRISDIMTIKDEVLKSGGWGIWHDFDTFRLKVESIWESGFSKFKFYLQKKGG